MSQTICLSNYSLWRWTGGLGCFDLKIVGGFIRISYLQSEVGGVKLIVNGWRVLELLRNRSFSRARLRSGIEMYLGGWRFIEMSLPRS